MKNAKKILITISIAIIFLLFVGYGIEVFNPTPERNEFCPEELYFIDNEEACITTGGNWGSNDHVPKPVPIEETVVREYCYEPKECYDNWDNAREKNEKIVFIVAVIIGLISIFSGFILKKEVVNTGFVSGGILVILYGTIRYWQHANEVLKFVLLGIVLFVLIWIAYRKMEKK
jgi:hypothetical protein